MTVPGPAVLLVESLTVRMMIRPTLISLTALVPLLACGGNGQISEGSGAARYLLKNDSSQALEFRFEPAPGASPTKPSIICAAGSECLVAEDSVIGQNPLPTESFASVSAWTSDTGTPVEAYRQDPVVDGKWTIDGEPAAFAPCCLTRDVRLTLSDDDLQAP